MGVGHQKNLKPQETGATGYSQEERLGSLSHARSEYAIMVAARGVGLVVWRTGKTSSYQVVA